MTRCSRCNKSLKHELWVSDGWKKGEKICQACFPRAADEELARDYEEQMGEKLRYQNGEAILKDD